MTLILRHDQILVAAAKFKANCFFSCLTVEIFQPALLKQINTVKSLAAPFFYSLERQSPILTNFIFPFSRIKKSVKNLLISFFGIIFVSLQTIIKVENIAENTFPNDL
jgi:hypothetical protein